LSGLIVRAAVQTGDDNFTVTSTTPPVTVPGKSAYDASAVYSAGPLTVALAFGDNGTKDGMSIGAAYNLKVATLRVRYIDSEMNNAEALLLGASVPFGKATAFIDYLKDESAAGINKALAGVSYELGKNTFVYGYIKTKDKTDDVIGVGLRHSF
jgi:predicted porin